MRTLFNCAYAVAFLVWTALSMVSAAQTRALVSVTSAAGSNVVAPGERFHLEVASGAVDVKRTVLLLDSLPPNFKAPVVFEGKAIDLNVPLSTPAGKYTIGAVSTTTSGSILVSDPVDIVVPVTVAVKGIEISNQAIRLEYAGQRLPLDVTLLTASGPLTISSDLLSFISEDTTIALVDQFGNVTAKEPGVARVLVSYKGLNGSVSRTITVHVEGSLRGDLNGDGRVDQSDIDVLASWIGHSANLLEDARDLDGDGQITANDVKLLEKLCTRPNCGTRR